MKKNNKKELKNLKKVLSELNKPYSFSLEDGSVEQYDSLYKFDYHCNNKHIKIWDTKEYFNINTDEENMAITYEACMEFGVQYTRPDSEIDRVFNLIKKAVQEDLELYLENIVVEWIDGLYFGIYW